MTSIEDPSVLMRMRDSLSLQPSLRRDRGPLVCSHGATPRDQWQFLAPHPAIVIENSPKSIASFGPALGSTDLSAFFDAAVMHEVGHSWLTDFAEWLASQREASFAAQVSAMLAKRRHQRDFLSLMVRSLTDVWARLEEFGVGALIRRALNLVLVSAQKAIGGRVLVACARLTEIRVQSTHRRSVLILVAPNPPTIRPDAIIIAIGLAV